MNESRLEKRLRFALKCSRIRWRKASPNRFASVEPNGGIAVIHLPPGHDDDYTLRTLLHELMHVAIHAELGSFGAFEEDIMIRVLEPRMMGWLTEHPRVQAWWLKRLREAKEAE